MDLIILYVLILIIPLIATLNINSTYGKYKQIINQKSLTGFDVARAILDANDMKDMYIVETPGNLTDHYDPRQKVVRLSTDIYHGNSIASVAVAAHECGHAIQDKTGYAFMRIRASLVPVVNFVTYSAYIMFFISIVLGYAGLLLVAIASVIVGLLFQLVTLPVEFDASRRALVQLEKEGLVDQADKEGSKKVLKAAALTYVAAVLSSLLNLLRLLSMLNRRR
ncbi:MAG: zinc metallopeptidase [Bacilli bacterium]|nr:zinc metallopeptidase [Bacilli bacterium]